MDANDSEPATVNQVKVAVWSIPRSASTIFAKCLCGIKDIVVFSELFSWAGAARSEYYKHPGKYLPDEVAGNEAIFEFAIAELKKTIQANVSPRRLSRVIFYRVFINVESIYWSTTNKLVQKVLGKVWYHK